MLSKLRIETRGMSVLNVDSKASNELKGSSKEFTLLFSELKDKFI
jgi:hypothetical protein